VGTEGLQLEDIRRELPEARLLIAALFSGERLEYACLPFWPGAVRVFLRLLARCAQASATCPRQSRRGRAVGERAWCDRRI
jgi:hypothetical protein